MAKINAELEAIVGDSCPEVASLSAANQKKLAEDLNAAHEKHDAFLKQSMDDALNHIPRLLRGTVKKILGL